jgi:hypothetical protein
MTRVPTVAANRTSSRPAAGRAGGRVPKRLVGALVRVRSPVALVEMPASVHELLPRADRPHAPGRHPRLAWLPVRSVVGEHETVIALAEFGLRGGLRVDRRPQCGQRDEQALRAFAAAREFVAGAGGELLLAVVSARTAVAVTHADAMADEAEASGRCTAPDVRLHRRWAGPWVGRHDPGEHPSHPSVGGGRVHVNGLHPTGCWLHRRIVRRVSAAVTRHGPQDPPNYVIVSLPNRELRDCRQALAEICISLADQPSVSVERNLVRGQGCPRRGTTVSGER